MKKTAKIFVLAAALTLGATVLSHAQIVVRIRPSHERIEERQRPPAPSPRHAWVDEDWKDNGHRGYDWNGGRWEAPPSEGKTYVAGHWNKNRHGSVWISGTWR